MATDRSLRNGMTVFFFFFFSVGHKPCRGDAIPQTHSGARSQNPCCFCSCGLAPRSTILGHVPSLQHQACHLEPKWLRTARYVTA
mmetsp:Transcript_9815/g.7487  ORF Transcript_9815/g.7487 Transcript_9815/m.7487 type:complete len:85 (+) Transcript_9815:183-437(+)